MRWLLGGLSACCIATACAAGASDTYDMIFREGSLDGLPEASVIQYSRMAREPGGTEDSDGTVRLTIGAHDNTELVLEEGGREGAIGSFPTSVGNPLIMYFMETAVRDVARLAGGSPFYVRNRVKEVLLEETPAEPVTARFEGREIAAKRFVLQPLEGDKNAARMQGYDTLTLEITVSDEVPGWYVALDARADGPEGAVYETRLDLTSAEEPEQ